MKNWTDLWLRYHEIKDKKVVAAYKPAVGLLLVDGFDEDSVIINNAVAELSGALKKMVGVSLKTKYTEDPAKENEADIPHVELRKVVDKKLSEQGYRFLDDGSKIVISALDDNGALYGVFHLIRKISEGAVREADELHNPSNPLRMLNHWDNMDGSIERGYSGNSFFFRNGKILVGPRLKDYARTIASIGINGVVINNVNVRNGASYLISERHYSSLRKLASYFEGYGIRLYLSLNFASPIELGGMDTCDPRDPEVISWWENKMWEVFHYLPNLGGFLVKADSEGRPGPFTYGRTQAEGANMLGDVVKKYDAIIIWRCFVYNCTQDWRDYKTDRARAAYDNFVGSDGDYHDNVILQIKNGPMDFQIREPVSPLFGGLKKTNQMIEFEIAQEYTGQQIDLCYLMPMYKEVLDFHTYCAKKNDTVADIVSGKTYKNQYCGMAAVTNTGDDLNWTGNDLAAANLYGFGRLCFDTSLSSEEIASEWVGLTYGCDAKTKAEIVDLLMHSRDIYEEYTSPLGIGWMVTPNVHYGCSVDGYEYSRWGTYHRADHLGIGVDRTMTGTGYTGQYNEPNSSIYADPSKCPDELILFFHHLPYTYVLKSGKTIIQHIYDTHFEGYEKVLKMQKRWEKLKNKLPKQSYENVAERFQRQAVNAHEWCDQVNSYFYRKSGIPDEKGRKIY